jgi:putative nucleotidyltransferase with HDIG domain
MLKKLFGLGEPKKETPAALMSDALRESILHSLGLRSVPVMPAAAQEAFKLATDPNAEVRDFVSVIEADEGLAARVMKIANSVFYDRGGGSKTIVEAVQVVGVAELRNLLNASLLAGLFPVKSQLRSELWGHNVATALTARCLARALLPAHVEQMFLAGLMHDIGKLLLLQQHVENFEKIVQRALVDGVESTVAEVTVYPFDHTHVGQMVAEKWRFSRELYDAIGDHHKPWGDIPQNSLTAIIKVSDLIAHVSGFGLHRDVTLHQRLYSPLLEEAWAFLDVPLKEQKQLVQQASLEVSDEFEMYQTWGRV